MSHYCGIDVSLEQSSVCIIDEKGKIVHEAKVLSEPDALVAVLLGARPAAHPDRAGGWSVVSMAACRSG